MSTYPETPKPPCPVGATYYAALLPRLRARTLTSEERVALRAHLRVCPTCQDEAAALADQVIEEGVRRSYGVPSQPASFLTLDDIQRRAGLVATDTAGVFPEANHAQGTDTRILDLNHRGKHMTFDEHQQPTPTTPITPTFPTVPIVPIVPPPPPEDSAPAEPGLPITVFSSSWASQPQSTLPGTPSRSSHRWRNAVAVASAVALIALFALLLRGFAAGKGVVNPAATGGASTVITQPTGHTPTASAQGQWHTVDSMGYTSQVFTQMLYPKFSPKDPSIVYEATLNPTSVRRSDDGGATWKTLALPKGSGSAIDIEIFTSPLDAHTAFLTVTANLPYGQGPDACPTSSLSASVENPTHGGILASGQVPCSTVYRSTNEGQTWKAVHFPVNGTIATPLTDSAPRAGTVIQAQGTRLYTMLNCGPSCVSPGGRLVSSSDGGATWKVADAGGLGSGVCDFAVAATGQTVFAAVSRGSCDAINSPVIAIDRSDDGGANWVHASFLPQGSVQGMAAVMVAGKTQLIVNVPGVNWQPHIINVTQSATEFLISTDGGRSFKHSPLKGIVTGARPVVAPLTIRADGSLVVAFDTTANGDDTATKLYTWKLGDASWQEFAPGPHGQLSTLLRTVAPDGRETFWAVIQAFLATPDNAQAFTFTIADYQP